jgi:hypothetical protein
MPLMWQGLQMPGCRARALLQVDALRYRGLAIESLFVGK